MSFASSSSSSTTSTSGFGSERAGRGGWVWVEGCSVWESGFTGVWRIWVKFTRVFTNPFGFVKGIFTVSQTEAPGICVRPWQARSVRAAPRLCLSVFDAPSPLAAWLRKLPY